MTEGSSNAGKDAAIAQSASEWLARRDRGLSPAEQDEYLQWLAASPSHREATARLEKSWQALDALAEWRPKHSPRPNPDLLARPTEDASRLRRGFPVFRAVTAAAIVACGVIGFYALRPGPGDAARPTSERVQARGMNIVSEARRLTLEDGTVVRLNRDGRIEAAFTPGERRVRLLSGEAHFAVTKNPARPFVVEADSVAVRAVGTAFDVRRAAGEVEVLVTEGKVHVERSALAPTPVVQGERAIVDTRSENRAPIVTAVSAANMRRTLAWQEALLEFADLPLSEVVAAFNAHNDQRVVIADSDTARVLVAGTFRSDNLDGFIRLLQLSFGVESQRRDDGTIVLRLSK
jgi:transmembrane sensor